MIEKIVILGGGSAGLLAALSLKRKLPRLAVKVVRSPEIGIIGVGEGTTPSFPGHLHDYLRLGRGPFFAAAKPTLKLGVRFLWGGEPFDYPFHAHHDFRHPDLPRPNGFYAPLGMADAGIFTALMSRDKALPADAAGQPLLHTGVAYHIENVQLVAWLEQACRASGVTIMDGMVRGAEVETDAGGSPLVTALRMDDGSCEPADFFIDCSGFRSELIGSALETPFVSFGDSLFNDRAIAGPRERADEPVRPYTTAEAMDAGWCWRIDHEHHINRGYVYSSAHLSDGGAEEEFRRKNPKVTNTRLVKFKTGRYAESWRGNVVGIGNAAGFVEPLEATALMIIALQCRALADGLLESNLRVTPPLRSLFNRFIGGVWDDTRDFLALHFKANHHMDTPYWQRCREEASLHGADPVVEFYREHGPSLLGKNVLLSANNPFGMEGYLALLTGMQMPHGNSHTITPAEAAIWERHRAEYARQAEQSLTIPQCLAAFRSPSMKWSAPS